MFSFPDHFWVGLAFPYTRNLNPTSEPVVHKAQLCQHLPVGRDLQRQVVEQVARVDADEFDAHVNQLWQHVALGLVIVDPQGQVIMANEQAKRVLLHTDTLHTDTLHTDIHSDQLGMIQEYLDFPDRVAIVEFIECQFANWARGVPSHSDCSSLEVRLASTALRASGEPDVREVGASYTEPQHDVSRWVRLKVVWRTAQALSLALEEISELRRLEEEKRAVQQQLWQLQRLELVNHLSSGIAHELNNMLQIVEAYGAIIRQDASCSQSVAGYVDEILSASSRGAVLVKRLLGFSRRAPVQLARIDLVELVGRCVELCRHAFASNLTVRFELPPHPVLAMLDATLIEQSLLNLFINARDAMPDGGELTIGLREEYLPSQEIGGKLMPDGLYVRLSVTDSGQGIAPHLQERVFEPFFTTKEAGVGTGLGLSLVRDILWAHGGAIDLQSRLGAGACFSVLLPLA